MPKVKDNAIKLARILLENSSVGDVLYFSNVKDYGITGIARRLGLKLKTKNVYAFSPMNTDKVTKLVEVTIVQQALVTK